MSKEQYSIKDLLIENGTITVEEAEQIVEFSQQAGKTFVTAAQELSLVTHVEITQALATALGLPYCALREREISRDVASLLTVEQAKHYSVIPIEESTGVITFAVPIKYATNLSVKDDLKRITKARLVKFEVSTLPDIERTLDELYRADTQLRNISSAVEEEAKEKATAKKAKEAPTNISDEVTEESKITQFVELVLLQAVLDGASDIHFDPQDRFLAIRYRIDGILYDQTQAPAASMRAVASRVKVMSGLDIANTRTPQDGRLSMNIANKKIDFRVATLPSVYGEKIVMRILDNSSASLPLEKLGFSENNLNRLIGKASNPYGAVLVTGPTGSGKSTTLYSLLNFLNSREKNIITIEDPVEYRLRGINQIQVNAAQKLTFASALRTILRADPDVILLGEIRDGETARIALEAAQTGHMVFSTLHTNDAASAIPRLSKMGVEGFMIAATLEAIVSQRLVRRLCPYCKESYTPSELDLKLGNFPVVEDEELPVLYKAVGCKECKNTGYSGRSGIHEVLTLSDAMRDAIIEGASTAELTALAVSEGMITMRLDGFEKAKQGFTTLDEINRVVSSI